MTDIVVPYIDYHPTKHDDNFLSLIEDSHFTDSLTLQVQHSYSNLSLGLLHTLTTYQNQIAKKVTENFTSPFSI